MIQIICFFSPAFLATILFEHKQSKPLSFRSFIALLFFFIWIINVLSLGLVATIFHHSDYVVKENLFNFGFAFKYLILSFAFSLILPKIYESGRVIGRRLYARTSSRIWRKAK